MVGSWSLSYMHRGDVWGLPIQWSGA